MPDVVAALAALNAPRSRFMLGEAHARAPFPGRRTRAGRSLRAIRGRIANWQRRIAAQNPSIFRSNSELGSTNSKLGSTNSGDRCQVGRQVRIATWVGRIAGANSKSPGCGPGTSFALTLLRIVRTGSERRPEHVCIGACDVEVVVRRSPTKARRGSWVGLVRSITSTAIELTSQSISGPRRGENSSRASPRVCAERSDAADLGEEAVPGLRR